MSGFRKLLLATAMLGATFSSAHAGIYDNTFLVKVSEGLTNGNSFNSQAPGFDCKTANVACAQFTYTGPLNFVNTAPQNGPGTGGDMNSAFGFTSTNVSGYSGSGTVTYNTTTQVANFNGPTSANFLGSSGSASSFAYGSLYSFGLGQLAAGTVLTITHDDGVSLTPNSGLIGTLTLGATTKITESVQITQGADYTLYFSRQNGTPSILQVAVPEPVSISILGVGLIGMGLIRRRSRSV